MIYPPPLLLLLLVPTPTEPKMAAKSPVSVFPITEPNHFSDYGFDPQIDYFQVVFGEAKRRQKKAYCFRSIDTLHFKLQKPDDPFHLSKQKKTNKKRRWWKNALLFFKSRWAHRPSSPSSPSSNISGPIYLSDPLSTGTAAFPYVNLREHNMDLHPHRITALPIYLVT